MDDDVDPIEASQRLVHDRGDLGAVAEVAGQDDDVVALAAHPRQAPHALAQPDRDAPILAERRPLARVREWTAAREDQPRAELVEQRLGEGESDVAHAAGDQHHRSLGQPDGRVGRVNRDRLVCLE